MMFGGTFAPRSWALCDGQILSIAQNTALFSILGTTYGGNGQTTFALPDLRGRAPIHAGSGPGLTPRVLGEMSGAESTTLITNNLAAHTHTAQLPPTSVSAPITGLTATLRASSLGVDEVSPAGNSLGSPASEIYHSGAPNDALHPNSIQLGGTLAVNLPQTAVTVGPTGNNLPFNNMQPYLAVNFIIALEGIFPSRN